VIFVFASINVLYILIDLCMLYHLCIPGLKQTWLWFASHLSDVLDSVWHYFLEAFCIDAY
jgi:hypothetical protein